MDFLKSRKKRWLFLAGIIFFTAMGYVIYSSGELDRKLETEIAMEKQTVFLSKNPAFNFSFDYPEGEWKPSETQGRRQKYDSLYLQGPVDKINEFAILIAITVKPLQEGETASGLLESHLNMSSNLKKFKIVNKSTLDLGGEKAFSAMFEEEMLLPREKVDAKPVQVLHQTLFLANSGRSYELTFMSTVNQWKEHLPVFEQVLKTFKFKK